MLIVLHDQRREAMIDVDSPILLVASRSFASPSATYYKIVLLRKTMEYRTTTSPLEISSTFFTVHGESHACGCVWRMFRVASSGTKSMDDTFPRFQVVDFNPFGSTPAVTFQESSLGLFDLVHNGHCDTRLFEFGPFIVG